MRVFMAFSTLHRFPEGQTKSGLDDRAECYQKSLGDKTPARGTNGLVVPPGARGEGERVDAECVSRVGANLRACLVRGAGAGAALAASGSRRPSSLVGKSLVFGGDIAAATFAELTGGERDGAFASPTPAGWRNGAPALCTRARIGLGTAIHATKTSAIAIPTTTPRATRLRAARLS